MDGWMSSECLTQAKSTRFEQIEAWLFLRLPGAWTLGRTRSTGFSEPVCRSLPAFAHLWLHFLPVHSPAGASFFA